MVRLNEAWEEDEAMLGTEDPSPDRDDRIQDEEDSDPVDVLNELQRLMNVPNIADELTEDQLGKIGQQVCDGAETDDQSREEWKARTRAGMDLALQKASPKSWPWQNAANIRFPLMTTAAIQFAARAYPAIIMDNQVVKSQVLGADPTGERRAIADRVAAHMSWQCLTEMPEWEPDVDKMLHNLPIVGCAFKKTYFSPEKARSCSPFISAFDLIVNAKAASLEVAPRITHEFSLYPNEIESRRRSGAFIEFDYQPPEESPDDKQAAQKFWEQHCRYDLDDDGYEEPYIVTCHKETKKVVRVVANYDEDTIRIDPATGKVIVIDPIQYFTKIPFIPHPDGEFYDVGFAWLLSPLNEAINTVINQLLDAGTLANTGGGFIGSGLRLKGGTLRFSPGEYKEIDVPGGTAKENIVPLTFPEPSAVLFQMLGLLIESGREIASVKDVLTGESKGANASPTTTIALIEQGLKVFTAIYKRIHRALKDEYAKLFRLNQKYMDEAALAAFRYDGPPIQVEDYKGRPSDIIPVSDPTMVSDMQKMARAQFLQGFLADPRLDAMEIYRRLFTAAGIENVPTLFAKQQGPTPDQLAAYAELEAKVNDMNASADEKRARALKAIAEAEAVEPGQQLEIYRAFLDAFAAKTGAEQSQQQLDQAAAEPAEAA